MSLASFFDHTILRPDCTDSDIEKVCREAVEYNFSAVCVPPFFVKKAISCLGEQSVKVATVVGFPMGYSSTPAKVEEIKKAIDEGVHELDAVVNIAAVKNGSWNYVRNDIYSIVTATQLKGKHVKIIFETSLLTEDEILKLCEICKETGPDYVKTSTGFNGEGATPDMVRLLRENLPKAIKIKASGGVRTKEDAQRLIDAGANRIGSSASVLIMRELV